MVSRTSLSNAIRALTIDAVQKASTGHPGAPMGMADVAEVLWREHLIHNPNNPKWFNRDRFILSNGHASMLIYSLLHLSGYDLDIEDIKNFRQLHSRTPGHPEYGYTAGVETTTGPLGQGLANAVGMALAEKLLAEQFNKPDNVIVDHFTYVFVGDGCLMEGISHEACSLAGTLGLDKLIVFWDDNGISIDGHIENWCSDDTPSRFESYGWHVISSVDGHNIDAINEAIVEAKLNPKPTLICTKTTIGFGSPNKEGTHLCHGAPLGDEELVLTKKNLNWPYDPFEIPDEIYKAWDAKELGEEKEKNWNDNFLKYEMKYPELASEFKRRISGELPSNWDHVIGDLINSLQANQENIELRKASQLTLESLSQILPEFLGGGADLAPSNLSMWPSAKSITPKNISGNYIHYGVREFAMTAIINGISLHGGFITCGATFLMFMEYARNAMRMAALMKIQNIQIYTHDSIGLGADGPTHQPVEQLASLRLTPNISTWRPCDHVESFVAWKLAIERKYSPSALIFARQEVPPQIRNEQQVKDISKGGYILKDSHELADIILIATGSEVDLAMKAAEQLSNTNINVRVVSMPSTDTFDKQHASYREFVLPSNITPRIAIEAGISDFWYKYVGQEGRIIGMTTFGESAPADDLFNLFGITVENIVKTARELIQ